MTTSMNGSGGGNGRGGCLTALLVLMMIANPLTAISYALMGDSIARSVHAPGWAIPVLGLAAAANTVFAIGIWRWQKWGVYGFLATSALALVTNIIIGINPMAIILGLGGPILLLSLLAPTWRRLR